MHLNCTAQDKYRMDYSDVMLCSKRYLSLAEREALLAVSVVLVEPPPQL